jgi:hypothetical protein
MFCNPNKKKYRTYVFGAIDISLWKQTSFILISILVEEEND